ncbi:MAG TPA: AI-2E family transporter [Anaerolineales bacterium]|jgi:predicted PurR-regulated permease PerM
MNDSRPRWPPLAKLVVSLLVLTLLIFLLFRFGVVIPPLILAVVLAYILTPLVNRIQERLKIHRGWATLLAYLIVVIAVTGSLAVLIPPLAAQLAVLNLDLQLIIENAGDVLGEEFVIFGQLIDGSVLFERMGQSLQGLIEPFIGQSLVFLIDVLTSFVWTIFVLVVSFYLIKDGQALRDWLEKLPPPEYREDFVRLRDEINRIWGSFFRGQLTLAFVVGVIFTSMGFILGLPFWLAMGLLAGLLEFLPSIGHGIWLAIAALLAFILGSNWIPIPNWAFMLLIIGLHLVFQQFDLNYLIPRIIGHSVRLPPLVVILGIVAGAVLAGVLGIPLAAPTIASARVIGRYIYANLFDLEPFPTSRASAPVRQPRPRLARSAQQEK